jgi:hypothetical protein
MNELAEKEDLALKLTEAIQRELVARQAGLAELQLKAMDEIREIRLRQTAAR